ncbi:hypothetical protein Mpsy_2295 [Methanolobus psychrophilus R15]|nr:hypothetical protein Mpsy_2295 [Methanolobus psychrophilus R15]
MKQKEEGKSRYCSVFVTFPFEQIYDALSKTEIFALFKN